jgi:hypothetical protein
VSLLMLLGLVFGYLAWQRWGPLAGIVVGFVFAGGLGWRLLGLLVTGLRLAARPRRTRQMRPFTEAWEARFGEIGPDSRRQPPPGMFRPGTGRGGRPGSRPATGWMPRCGGTGPNPARPLWRKPSPGLPEG